MTRSPARIARKRAGSAPQVELSHPDAHPIVIGYQWNGIMGKYELLIAIGNFDSEAAARAYAAELIDRKVFSTPDSLTRSTT